jgi:hypothetical protein
VKVVKVSLLIILSVGAFVGCSRFSVSTPEGFAEIDVRGRDRYLAVSPEGVRFSLRTVKNYPEKELSFWKDALKNHMEEAGYALIEGPETISAKEREGVFFEWGAPYQGEDYLYLTGLFISGKKIVIAEAAGPYELYSRHRETLQKALEELELR